MFETLIGFHLFPNLRATMRIHAGPRASVSRQLGLPRKPKTPAALRPAYLRSSIYRAGTQNNANAAGAQAQVIKIKVIPLKRLLTTRVFK